jgi:peptide/nickel transport system substrate-binding protein
MKRRDFLAASGAATLQCALLPGRASAQKSAAKTLRIIHAGNLAVLDPIWTTAPGTKDYGYLTFDQLIALDADYVPQPEMAEGWTIEDNGRSYVIGLREGLKFP